MPPSAVVVDRAAHMDFRMLQTSDVGIYSTGESYEILEKLSVSASSYENVLIPPMWTRRPNRGEAMGENRTALFGEELQRWVEEAEKDIRKKKSASMMWEVLRETYAWRYDLPSEYHIKNFIQRCSRKKKGGPAASETALDAFPRVITSPLQYAVSLEKGLDELPKKMPHDARNAVMHQLNVDIAALRPDLPDDKMIRTRWSAAKSRRKRRRAE